MKTLQFILTVVVLYALMSLTTAMKAHGQTTLTLTANSNWSTCNAGAPPAANTAITLAGYTLTLDGTAANPTYTCASIGGNTSAGYVILGATSSAGCTLGAGFLQGAGGHAASTLGRNRHH